MIDKSKLKELALAATPVENNDAYQKWTVAANPAAILELLAELESARNAALEEAAEKLESMNDSAGDRASYDNRDMTCCEAERMHALMQAVEAIRSLATTTSTEPAKEPRPFAKFAERVMAGCNSALRAEPAWQHDAFPAVLFDGMAVYEELTNFLGGSHCYTVGAVSATLDAVVRLIRKSLDSEQSNRAGAARQGGVTCPDCHGVGTYLGNDGGYSDDSCDTCDGSGLAHVVRQESGAVAEGVDTAEVNASDDAALEDLIENYFTTRNKCHDEFDRDGAFKKAHKESKAALFAYIDTTYGAQQREAARRERDSEVARLRDRVNKLSVDVAEQREAGRREQTYRQFVEDWATKAGWDEASGEGAFEYVQRISYEQGFADQNRKPEYACQPVSEGLTEEAAKLAPILRGMCEGGDVDDDIDIYADGYQACDGDVYVVRAAKLLESLSAVPPAKAEGMSDEQMWHAAASEVGTEIDPRYGERIVLARPADVGDLFRAILAQQAKKGNQQ